MIKLINEFNRKRILFKYKAIIGLCGINEKCGEILHSSKDLNDYLAIDRINGKIGMRTGCFGGDHAANTEREKIVILFNGFIDGIEMIPNNKNNLFFVKNKKKVCFKTHKKNYTKLQKVDKKLYKFKKIRFGRTNKCVYENLYKYSYDELEEMDIDKLKKNIKKSKWVVVEINIDDIEQFVKQLREKYMLLRG